MVTFLDGIKNDKKKKWKVQMRINFKNKIKFPTFVAVSLGEDY